MKVFAELACAVGLGVLLGGGMYLWRVRQLRQVCLIDSDDLTPLRRDAVALALLPVAIYVVGHKLGLA